MSIIKGLLTAIASVVLVGAGALYYLLQPSGSINDFSQWFAPQQKTTPSSETLTVKFFGVSTLLFNDGKSQILIDGFFSRPSLSQVAFQKLSSNEALIEQLIQTEHLKRLDAILVTHSHYDHTLDIAALGRKLSQAKIIGSSSTLNIAQGGQVRPKQLQLAQAFQSFQLGQYKITPIPSQHTPPTAVNNDLGEDIDQPLTQPARFFEFKEGGSFDYLIEHQGTQILVKASTGAIPEQFKNLDIDILFLGVAQLAKQTPEFQTQYLAETIDQLNPNQIIPIHWDNFFKPLTQPLELLPNIADQAPESLQLVIQHGEAQNRKITILNTASTYRLKKSSD